MMSGRRWTALIIAAALFILSVVIQLTGDPGKDDKTDTPFAFQDSMFKEKVLKRGTGSKKIAVLNLDGVIQDLGSTPFMDTLAYDHRRFLEMIEYAGEDPNVEGVIVNVNSPGGGVVESAEIHDKLIEVQEEYNKPVYASMGNVAASGGYYVSAPADKIVAHPATLTGSIGVITESVDISELADEYGIDFNTIKSGKHKDIMSPKRKMTDEEEEILQVMTNDLYDDIVEVIVNGRDMSEEKVRELGDGRIYTRKQAKEHELVDDLGTLDDAIKMMKEEQDLKGAQVIEYEPGYSLRQMFSLSADNILRSDAKVHDILNLIEQSRGPRLMYLYAG